jgi:hypothetical protein
MKYLTGYVQNPAVTSNTVVVGLGLGQAYPTVHQYVSYHIILCHVYIECFVVTCYMYILCMYAYYSSTLIRVYVP